MADIYSTYEAKARFSEILRRVRDGQTIVVSYHGEPVAEIRPLRESAGLSGRLDRLEARGVLVRAARTGGQGRSLPVRVKRRRGALERFLEERGD